MTILTFQVLEGMERGRVLADLAPPLTIGREEDNAVQLNDERVSRFHAKVQEDGGRILLTDLQSTNGTRVNGHPIQMHVLRIGDQVSIGRCLLLYGSADQIEQEIVKRKSDEIALPAGTISFESDIKFIESLDRDSDEDLPRLFPDGRPELPGELRPVQVAQLCDLLAHLHDRMRSVINAARSTNDDKNSHAPFEIEWIAWQRMLKLEMDLAGFMRELTGATEAGEVE
jgi:predicted component of type VI protein secretion system